MPDSASRRLAGRVELEAQLPKRSSICGRRLRIQNFLCSFTMANTQAAVTAERWKSRCAANLLRWVTAIAKTADVIPPRRERVHVVEKRERSPYQRSGVPRAIQEQRHQRPRLLHKVRRPHHGRSPELTDVRLGALRKFQFKPAVHLNYEETVLPMRDGLPKLKDFPAAIGGSGETPPK